MTLYRISKPKVRFNNLLLNAECRLQKKTFYRTQSLILQLVVSNARQDDSNTSLKYYQYIYIYINRYSSIYRGYYIYDI